MSLIGSKIVILDEIFDEFKVETAEFKSIIFELIVEIDEFIVVNYKFYYLIVLTVEFNSPIS